MSSSTAHIDSGEPARGDRLQPSLRALADSATYGLTGAVSVHETHASWVFVCGARAYKVKKPVALGFLDYSTLARRRAACREEVLVNRELAGELYLGVRAIVATPAGLRLGDEGAGDAVEYAVEMRSFREQDTLSGQIAAGALTHAQLVAVARRLAAFHRRARSAPGGAPSQVLAIWRENLDGLVPLQARFALAWDVELAAGFAEAFVRTHAAEIEGRRARGLVRDGHGDLRCEHVLVRPQLRVVDRIEFDPAMRQTDIACDLAFLTMDLEAEGEPWAAQELVSAYRLAGGDPGSDPLLSFHAAYRALVRAKVALVAAAELDAAAQAERLARAGALRALAEQLSWRARAPLAIVVCGPAGSGKSTLAGQLARRSGLPVVSTDALRKAAAGLEATERAGPELYSERATRATYERLAREARAVLERGGGVIVDATCRSREHRARLLGALAGDRLTRLVVRCDVPLEVARERAALRMGDPERVSDASPEVVAEHHRTFEPLAELPAEEVLELDAVRPLDRQLEEVVGATDRLLAAAPDPGEGGRAGGR